ncbi:MAG: hypothetical protein AAGH81_11555 [Bacteroidota bacterium]
MDLLMQAKEFEKMKMSHLSTSDRVKASRHAKELVLAINEIYKKNRDSTLMDAMKRITEKKRKIDKRLKGRLTV